MTDAPPMVRPRAYNTARRFDLTEAAWREEARAEFDRAEALGEDELGRWATAWSEAIRSDLRGRRGAPY